MKASTEYAIGDEIVLESGLKLLKESEAQEGQNVDPEIWIDEDGNEREPTLEFSMGQSSPAFNPL